MSQPNPLCVGIDVSKVTLDIAASSEIKQFILNVLQDASTYPAEDTNSKPLSRSCRAS